MADETAIARRYAKALMALGKETGNTETLATDLTRVHAAFSSHGGQLKTALSHPALLPSERRGVLEAVLERVPINAFVANTLRLMLDKGRAALLDELVHEFGLLADTEAGRVRAHVTTATALSPEMLAEVLKTLEASTGKTVIIDSSVDAELIGGMVVKVGSIVYDASVRNHLDQIKQSLLNSSHIVPGEA
jgi:F-type H+-transporting ATPase subunit delta